MENNNTTLSDIGVAQEEEIAKSHTFSAQDVAKAMQEKHGVAPPEKEKRYDSLVDEMVETVGQRASDEAFERAKRIIESKRAEIEMQASQDVGNSEFVNSSIPIADEFEEESSNLYVPETPQTISYESEEPAPVKTESTMVAPGSIDDMIEEFEEDEFEEGKDEMSIIKSKVLEKIKPISEKLDLNTFTISNKPISVIASFEKSNMDTRHVSDWVLPDSGVILSFIEMKGYDIEKLNPYNSGRNPYNMYKDIYGVIYNHIDGDKPSFEEFLKLVKFSDIDHLYGGLYRASFDKNNFITYKCENKGCGEIFIDEVDMDTVYKFVDDKAEAKFNSIVEEGKRILSTSQFESVLVQISDEFAFSIKEPSVFNVVFESAILDDVFKEKYSDIIGLLSYIDSIYYIDKVKNNLEPIGLQVYKDDLQRTVKYKTVQYAKILQKLSSDQYYNLTAVIRKISPENTIKYVLPETVCPKCKKKVSEIEYRAEDLLFTRHQLGAIGAI